MLWRHCLLGQERLHAGSQAVISQLLCSHFPNKHTLHTSSWSLGSLVGVNWASLYLLCAPMFYTGNEWGTTSVQNGDSMEYFMVFSLCRNVLEDCDILHWFFFFFKFCHLFLLIFFTLCLIFCLHQINVSYSSSFISDTVSQLSTCSDTKTCFHCWSVLFSTI